jgi:hypothetical protein
MAKVIINDNPVKIENTKTVLSFKSPSPKWAGQMFTLWVMVSMIAGLAIVTFADEIPDNTEAIVNKCLIFGTGVMRIVTKAFGLEVKED